MKTSELAQQVSSGRFTLRSVLGEVVEVFQAKSYTEFKEEVCDVYTTALLWLYTQWSVDFTIVWEASARKYLGRTEVWRKIFRKEGLEFKPAYIRNGGNYTRPEKVTKALALAREAQD